MSKIKKLFNKDIRYKCDDTVCNYTIKKYLGEGRYGITYLAENTLGDFFTIKQLKKSMLEKTLSKVEYESNILKELNEVSNNFFPKFISNFKDEDREGYILEYIDGNTFENILYKQNKVFGKKEIYNIALQLVDMVAVLEERNIVHKDIRVTNVIYTMDNQVKLIDFGLARYVDNKKYKKDLDYWYLSDFLIHLHYSNYTEKSSLKNKSWYDELDLLSEERNLLMSMMGIGEKKYSSIQDIENDIKKIIDKI